MKNAPAPVFDANCAFCQIVRGIVPSHKVFEDDFSLAFLDHRPLFPGHTLFVSKSHIETLFDLPEPLVGALFAHVQLLARAVMQGMKAEGSFVAINNRVSQSVPHFHVHIVPRRKGDGLRGFMWPRHKYSSAAEAEAVGKKIRDEIARLQSAENIKPPLP